MSSWRALLIGGLGGLAAVLAAGCATTPPPRAVPVPIADTWTWEPELSPTGPVRIDVSLSAQRLWVYRNGVEIGSSPISSGRGTKPTPPGSYSILEKKPMHRSTLYGAWVNAEGREVRAAKASDPVPAGYRYVSAKMPWMQRLTWDGICLHQGPLPGYPASSGCIRLPQAFAERLYTVTKVGTPIVVR